MSYNEFLADIFYSDLPEFRRPPQVTSNEIDNTNNDDGLITISDLNGLIKQKRNTNLKSVLLKEKPLLLINKQESTLFHTAVLSNNIVAITLLFNLQFNINARNSLGETPLLLAARKYFYQAVQTLLTLGADVFLDDFSGENTLAVLLEREKNIPSYIIGSLFEILKNSRLSSNGIVNIFNKYGCPLEHVLMFDDAEITREMLSRLNNIDKDTSIALLHSAMLSRNMENVRVLLQYDPDVANRRKIFIEKVTKNILDPESRPFVEQVVNWGLVSSALLDKVARIFKIADENVIELLLNVGIADYSENHFHRNLMINLFYNKKVDVAKLLKNRRFNVNSANAFGITAFRLAIQRGNKAGVMYLLENGADINRKDRNGQTPIFDCHTDEMRKFLLAAGADMFVIDNAGRTIIDRTPSELLKANYCILEAKRLMDDNVLHTMFSQNAVLEPFRKDIQWMKNRKITDSISLLSVLIEKVEKTTRHVKAKSTVAAVLKAVRERELQPIYALKLKKNLKEAIKMHALQSKAAAFLSDVIRIVPPDHLAIEKIINFLTYQDLMVFDKINE